MKDFFIGLRAYKQGFKLISELKLWKFFFIPALIGFFVGGGILTAAWFWSDQFGSWLVSWWIWDFGKSVVDWIGQFLGGAAILVLGFVVYKHIVMALSAPFMAPISEKTEMHLTGRSLNETDTSQEYMRTLLRGIKINIRNLFRELLFTIPLLILGFIPLIGLLSGVAILYVQSYYSGYGNMDYTLERHLDYNETKKFVSANKGLAVGNGFVFTLMLFIPLIGMMLTLPVSTAAATIQTVQRIEQNKQG